MTEAVAEVYNATHALPISNFNTMLVQSTLHAKEGPAAANSCPARSTHAEL